MAVFNSTRQGRNLYHPAVRSLSNGPISNPKYSLDSSCTSVKNEPQFAVALQPATSQKISCPKCSARFLSGECKCSWVQQGMNMTTVFDILKKDRRGTFLWLEAVNNMEAAQTRLRQLSEHSTDEFVVFRNVDLKVVATSRKD
jgi:hypothetical protein